MVNSDPRILLAIDYGTTFTGVAWTNQTNGSSKVYNKLNLLDKWHDNNSNIKKVPSEISYTQTTLGKKQWGFSIEPNSIVFNRTKLELMPRSPAQELSILRNLLKDLQEFRNSEQSISSSNQTPRHLAKSADEVIEDFLTRVVEEWYQYMVSLGKKTIAENMLDVIVTFPAKWSYPAKNATIRAIRAALRPGMFPYVRDFYIVSEPEACALFSVQDMRAKNHNLLFKGDCFIIVDAGGGTVDVASYRIDSLDPLRLIQVGAIDGKACGATYVDEAFLAWLEPKLLNVPLLSQNMHSGGHSVFEPLSKHLLEDFQAVKHSFDAVDTANIQLPTHYIDSQRVEHTIDPAPGCEDIISDGVITLSYEDIKGIFDTPVEKIVDMIRKQVAAVELEKYDESRLAVKNIFLSGGFSKNPYLRKRIRQYSQSHAHINVHPVHDEEREEDYDCLTAVVQGALLKGMGIGSDLATKVEICPRHFGVSLSEAYKEWRDGHANNEVTKGKFHQKEMVLGQLTWLVKRGDVIEPDSPITASTKFSGNVSTTGYRRGANLKLTFVATNMAEAPTNISGLNKDFDSILTAAGTHETVDLLINLSEIPQNELGKHRNAKGLGHYFTADLVAEIEISRQVTFTIKHGSKVLNVYQTDLMYKEMTKN